MKTLLNKPKIMEKMTNQQIHFSNNSIDEIFNEIIKIKIPNKENCINF